MCAGHQPPAGDRKRGSTLKCAQVISLVTGERGTDGMAKFIQYDMDNADALCRLGKALSSPARLEILKLLYGRDLIIGSIAKELGLPVSSTAFHLRVLEEAGLISMEELPNTRGSMKLCRCSADRISVDLAWQKIRHRRDLQRGNAGGRIQQLQGDPHLRPLVRGRHDRK